MQKFTEFLEKNVEWIALGLGGLFLLWVVWAYVITPPVTVRVGSRDDLTLGEVDRYVRDNIANKLKQAIDNPQKPDVDVPRLDEAFARLMDWQGKQPSVYRDMMFAVLLPTPDTAPQRDERRGPQEQIFVESLPTLPSPQIAYKHVEGQPTQEQAIDKGRSLVAVPPVATPVLQPGNQGAPAMPTFDPANPGANVQQVDKVWVSLRAVIPMQEVAKAFADARMFQVAPNSTTIFLRIEVEREERLPDGTWGNRTTVPPLAINPLPPLPDGTNREDAFAYIDWASQNAPLILKPPFYPVLRGTTWRKPGDPEPQDVLPVVDEQERIRQQQLQQDERARRQREAAERRQLQQQQRDSERPGRTTPRRRDREPSFAPRDLERPASSLDGTVVYPQVRGPRGEVYDPAFDEYPPMDAMPAMRGRPDQTVLVEIPEEVTRQFRPSDLTPDVEIWVHDDTVQSGKTYRYRVRYKMQNPIYGLFNVSRPENLTEQFALTSEWSQWSQPVGLDSLVRYFVYSTRPNTNSVNFEVFKWENGIWQSEIFQNLQPGDMIGGVRVKNNVQVDFTTGVTIVDIREDARRERFILLVDAQGNLLTRNFRLDQNNAEYRELREKARQDAAANQPAAAVR